MYLLDSSIFETCQNTPSDQLLYILSNQTPLPNLFCMPIHYHREHDGYRAIAARNGYWHIYCLGELVRALAPSAPRSKSAY